MINSVSLQNIGNNYGVERTERKEQPSFSGFKLFKKDAPKSAGVSYLMPINTSLRTPEEHKMYNELVSAVNASQPGDLSVLPQQTTQAKKLDALLKNGKLLSSASNDGSTTLQNLHRILNEPRLKHLGNLKILNQTIDAIFDPTIITQKFGDVPREIKDLILASPQTSNEAKVNPDSINVANSGTCVATSIEFHLANKHPAEFARWVEGLSSPSNSINQKVDMSSLSKNFLDAIWLLDAFKLKTTNFNFNSANLVLKPDKNAISRVMLQNDYQDPGERSVIDVLIQSTIMHTGSQQTYDTLIDERKGDFNSNPQGLIEFEKTFVESVIENKEKLSIVYQNVDENQVLLGYRCDLKKIEEHIRATIKSGEDVIIGYVLTNSNNKIINGHEITIVDVKKGKGGETIFVCNDTDSGENKYIEYTASYLLPKIHHAGYPAKIVEHEEELLYAA